MTDCIFCKIIAGEIPSNKLYEDEDVLAFWDISPQAPKHFLVIPKLHLPCPTDVTEEHERLVGKMIRIGAKVAAEIGIGSDFRVVINNGSEAGQVVFHTHMHVLGGRPMGWPPG